MALPRGERVLAGAELARGGWVVATTHALIRVSGGEPGETGEAGETGESGESLAADRRGWERAGTAAWADTADMLQVSWIGTPRPMLLEFGPAGAGYLPEVVRERVEASVVISRRVPVDARRGVTVAIRRAGPGAPLVTQVVPDRGVKLDDPEVTERVAAELADLRDAVGMR